MMEYVLIVAVIVVVLAFLFLRKGKEEPTDYVEPTFKASGHPWVFNGILDIDNPPRDLSPFTDYEGEMQLMVKKGFVHYDLILDTQAPSDAVLGMFRARAYVEGGRIVIRQGDTILGRLPSGLTALQQSIGQSQEGREAYGFIAKKGNTLSGEVCIGK